MVPYLIPTAIASVEEEITGKNHSAMYFAIQALATSVVGAIASSLIYNYLKLWVEHPENINTGNDLGWKYGVTLVPLIVAVACIVGFFLCFLMPKNYSAETIYNDIYSSAKNSIRKLNITKDRILAAQEKKINEIQMSKIEEEYKTALIDELVKNNKIKIAKIELSIASNREIIDYKFNAQNSIGNEEKGVIENQSMVATVGLFILTGGIFGIVSLFIDRSKLKHLGVKNSKKSMVFAIISLFIPFVSIYNDIYFGKQFKALGEKYKIDLKYSKIWCIIGSVILPLFMNIIGVIYRTKCFNAIEEHLAKEEK